MVSKTKKKKGKVVPSSVKKKKANLQKGVPAAGTHQKVDLPKFLKEFDSLLNKKDFDGPQKMLDGLRGIKKWQRLNLQSVIEFKRGREDLSEDIMRQALREPDVRPSINRNLQGC